MKNISLLIGTIVGTLILIVGVAVIFSKDTTSETQAITADPQLLIGDSPNVKGATESAQVTIVEFSDLQCPACRATYPLADIILEKYGDRVQFVYRHFPLDAIHPNARYAAQFAQAAGELGKFWEVHDLLFERQNSWADISSKQELQETFLEYATELEIDKTALLEKIESSSVTDRVTKDTIDGNKIGISATPTFFVNGTQVPAPQLVSAVESLVTSTTQPEE